MFPVGQLPYSKNKKVSLAKRYLLCVAYTSLHHHRHLTTCRKVSMETRNVLNGNRTDVTLKFLWPTRACGAHSFPDCKWDFQDDIVKTWNWDSKATKLSYKAAQGSVHIISVLRDRQRWFFCSVVLQLEFLMEKQNC